MSRPVRLLVTRLRRAAEPLLLRASLLACLVALAVLPASLARAQQDGGGAVAAANFIPPFPENDTWRGVVIGDFMASGLLVGLLDALSTEPRLQLQRTHRQLNSLSRTEVDEDLKAVDDFIAKEKVHIAIVMLGTTDRTGIRLSNGRRLAVNQGDWRAQFSGRVDRMVKLLRRRGVAVYWVGMPIVRRQDWNEEIEAMNEVFLERAGSNGARYIDAYKEMSDENGQFSDRGVDVNGKAVRLRDQDGYDLTPSGYRKLAFFLERELKRDMTTARNERAIPLAGSEAEQKRINPDATKPAAPNATASGAAAAIAKGGKAAVPSPAARAVSGLPPAVAGVAADNGQPGDVRADNVRVTFRTPETEGREEQVTLEILRPTLTASVVALVTRKDRGDKASQVGDTLTDTLSNGLMVMRSVTATRDSATRGARGAPTRQPFFIALSKGERLPSKPGRADDFRWPREDDLPPPTPAVDTRPSAAIGSPVQLKQQGGRPQRASAPRPAQPSNPLPSPF